MTMGRPGRPSNRNELGLTIREQQVVNGLLAGKKLRRIGAELGLSHATVRNHLKHAFTTLSVSSQVELIAKMSGRLAS